MSIIAVLRCGAKSDTAPTLGLLSTTMPWFSNPDGVAKKLDEIGSLVPNPMDPNVMVSSKK